jgi:hypothetical protein
LSILSCFITHLCATLVFNSGDEVVARQVAEEEVVIEAKMGDVYGRVGYD